MYTILKEHCDKLTQQFESISEERKEILSSIAQYIEKKRAQNLEASLIYICTHNSRRSHFGQVWSQVAADYYNISGIKTYSGGTEVTAFHPNSIDALQRTGFVIESDNNEENPHYTVRYGDMEAAYCFSKVYDDASNPQQGFAAVMVCSSAEQNCPFVAGAEFRISCTYEDPKDFDGTSFQSEKYLERSNQIALECLYMYSTMVK